MQKEVLGQSQLEGTNKNDLSWNYPCCRSDHYWKVTFANRPLIITTITSYFIGRKTVGSSKIFLVSTQLCSGLINMVLLQSIEPDSKEKCTHVITIVSLTLVFQNKFKNEISIIFAVNITKYRKGFKPIIYIQWPQFSAHDFSWSNLTKLVTIKILTWIPWTVEIRSIWGKFRFWFGDGDISHNVAVYRE